MQWHLSRVMQPHSRAQQPHIIQNTENAMVTTATAVPFIRPLSLAELLDQAIGLYRRNFLTFIGIIAIAYIPVGILQALVAFLLTSSLQPEAISSPEALLSNTGYWLGMAGSLVLWIIQLIL